MLKLSPFGSRPAYAPVLMIWALWVFGCLILVLAHGVGVDSNLLRTAVVFLHLLATLTLLNMIGRSATESIVLGLAFVVRALTAFLDTRTGFVLPFQEDSDSTSFFEAAVSIANDPSLAGSIYGGWYTAIVGYGFFLMGVDRLIAQYANVLLSITSIVFMLWFLRWIGVPTRSTWKLVALVGFMPTAVLFSSVLLREAIIQCLVTVGVISFLKGFLERQLCLVVLGAACVIVASGFHAGVVAMLFGFSLVIGLFSRKNGTWKFNPHGLVLSGVLMAGIVVGAALVGDSFLFKFAELHTLDDVYQQTNARAGGSAYLASIEITNLKEVALLGPIRMFYIIGSPFPWDWRGVPDLVVFFSDAAIYLGALILGLVSLRMKSQHLVIGITLLASIVCSLFLFGLGVGNSGTAVRHRFKFLMIFIMLTATVIVGWWGRKAVNDAAIDGRRASLRRQNARSGKWTSFERVPVRNCVVGSALGASSHVPRGRSAVNPPTVRHLK